jgi:hypothetical protein
MQTQWSEMFPGIVVSATANRIITPSASQHGMIQLVRDYVYAIWPIVVQLLSNLG